MLDFVLRPTKENALRPFCRVIPSAVVPIHLTLVGFLFGLASCSFTAIWGNSHATKDVVISVVLWLLNRFLDSLDGSLARERRTVTEAGGFIDLLCDFLIYSLIPPAVAHGEDRYRSRNMGLPPVNWRSVAYLEVTFHINNFLLFYAAAVAAKVEFDHNGQQKSAELTSVVLRPALIEGFESGIMFTIMLAFPSYIESVAWVMGCTVTVGIIQRVMYIVPALVKLDQNRVKKSGTR
ncbi:hypothetical protein N7539_004458 [Penicillium diatomitis]|uniref:CDP-alcohol phosphatidyltransferase n=1 Tax=Penicillium diatomitis TaxID=2819901 RepID=A0A9X0BYN4_9EURO|nr:uncharacterized protein N7539_004458 [Penicillium diatomitis]KAJ5489568.1 hypothetical protein N7539_004458 [Penicillium diatomitis]